MNEKHSPLLRKFLTVSKSILVAAIIFCFFQGCKKVDVNTESTPTASYKERFFTRPSFATPEIDSVLNLLREVDAKDDFVNKLPAYAGTPVWDKFIDEKPVIKRNEAARGVIADKEHNYLIPLSNNGKTLSGLLFAIYQNDKYSFYCYTNDYLYKICFSTYYSVPVREKVLALFMYMSNYVFGISEFKSIPDGLFQNPKDKKDGQYWKFLKIKPVEEPAPDTAYVESLRFLEVCILRPDPDHCTCLDPTDCDWADGCYDCSILTCYSDWTPTPVSGGGYNPLPAGEPITLGGSGGGGSSTPPCPGAAWYVRFLETGEPGSSGGCNPIIEPPPVDCGPDGALIDDNNCASPNNYPGMEYGFPYKWWQDKDWVDANFNFDIDNNNTSASHVNAEEWWLIFTYPRAAAKIWNSKNVAITETEARFGAHPGYNNKSDAFKHTYWIALNKWQLENDDLVRQFSDAHESDVPADREIEKRMDLHNNQIGMNLAVPTWPTAADISQAAYNAVAIGFCWYIRPLNSDWSLRTDSELHSTNE